MKKTQHLLWAAPAGLVMALAACGGGGSSSAGDVQATGATAGSSSSGAISAFGSVFVNGHEFSTTGARVIDDDTGASTSSTSALEVGEVVDVKPAGGSSSKKPMASELHVHPLARGYVDATDLTNGVLTVMGQAIQLTSATSFSDHRSCVTANACTAITGQAGFSATTPGTYYVAVHGFLFDSGATANSANIVASLVSVNDVPTGAGAAQFKVEGVVSAIGASTLTIGGLTVGLSAANCTAAGKVAACASAYSVGQVVSAFSATAPSLPATTFAATRARLSSKISVDTTATTVELEGAVSAVTSSPASFTLRGVAIDASALPGGASLPAKGDVVRVVGTLGANGESVTATSLTVLHAASSSPVALEGDASAVAAGSAADTYVLTVMGQSVTVTAQTRLADRSTKTWYGIDPATNPFNIHTFQTYLAASASQHVVVNTQSDATGKPTALSLVIVPASSTSGVAGRVDAAPAPAVATGISSFSVHGIPVRAATTLVFGRNGQTAATVAAGDLVQALGSYAAGTLRVSGTASRSNEVIDVGTPARRDRGGF